MKTKFALVDCNNFYASCERVFNPRLIGRPVAILSNNDSCVIARSEEVEQLGIPMGAPAHQHKAAFAKSGVVVLSSNYSLYGGMSARHSSPMCQQWGFISSTKPFLSCRTGRMER